MNLKIKILFVPILLCCFTANAVEQGDVARNTAGVKTNKALRVVKKNDTTKLWLVGAAGCAGGALLTDIVMAAKNKFSSGHQKIMDEMVDDGKKQGMDEGIKQKIEELTKKLQQKEKQTLDQAKAMLKNMLQETLHVDSNDEQVAKPLDDCKDFEQLTQQINKIVAGQLDDSFLSLEEVRSVVEKQLETVGIPPLFRPFVHGMLQKCDSKKKLLSSLDRLTSMMPKKNTDDTQGRLADAFPDGRGLHADDENEDESEEDHDAGADGLDMRQTRDARFGGIPPDCFIQ